MYDYFKGIVTSKSNKQKENTVTIEVNNIGYIAEITEKDYYSLPELNNEIKIYLSLSHREDKMELFGFLRREDRDLFKILTTVSGVGAKMALALLNELDASQIIGYVIDGNYKGLKLVKGIGEKVAQKIIIELKQKMINFKENTEPIMIISTKSQDKQSVDDAQAVLFSLGYDKNEIKNAITRASEILEQNASAEAILKEALQTLAN